VRFIDPKGNPPWTPHSCRSHPAAASVPVAAEFGLTKLQAGLVGSATFAGMFIGTGVLADGFGRLKVFKYSIIIWGSASVLLALSWDFASLASFRLLLGIGMGGIRRRRRPAVGVHAVGQARPLRRADRGHNAHHDP
jgi:MFS family permease